MTNPIEPVASAGNALSEQPSAIAEQLKWQLSSSDARNNLDLSLVWKLIHAALASQSTPVAPVVEQAQIRCPHGVPHRYACDVCDAALAQSTPHVPAGEPSDVQVDALLTTLLDAQASVTRWHTEYMGKAMPESVYDRFAFLRDTRIPETKKAILALATPRPPEPAAPVAQEPFGCVTKTRNGVQDFWPHPQRPYLDTAIECVTVYAAPTAAQGLSDAERLDWVMRVYGVPGDRSTILSANRAAQETK